MQKHSKLILKQLFMSLATLLFIATTIGAIVGNDQEREQAGSGVDPVPEESPYELGGKDPKAFTPSEKVTADQAIAFPSDI